MEQYDSTLETLKHIKRVQDLLLGVVIKLIYRATEHDKSKFSEQEKPFYDKLTPLLKDAEYQSPEYKQFLIDLKPALNHHYANNSHHPEHYENGINGMDLLDLIEMLVDWKAAGERNKNGNIYLSIELNKTRFNISEQLTEILNNTAKKLDF
jgi:hypothetical protein